MELMCIVVFLVQVQRVLHNGDYTNGVLYSNLT